MTIVDQERRPEEAGTQDTPVFEIDGNRLNPIVEGEARLAALIAVIGAAQRELRLIYYIFADDAVGLQVRDALVAAARRGVAVSLLIDGFGCEATPNAFLAPLRAAGGKVCRFVPRFGRRYLLRNHQKLTLADERIALIGGFNVEAGYFGEGAEHWRDFALRIEGPAVAALGGYHDALLEWARDRHATMRALARLIRRRSEDSGDLRWLFGGPTRRLSPWARALRRDMMTSASARRDRRLFRAQSRHVAPPRAAREARRHPHPHRREIRQRHDDRGGAQFLCPAAQARRADMGIPADAVAHQALRV